MIKKILFLSPVLAFGFFWCYHVFFPPLSRLIYYTYQDVTVTRLEKRNKIYFYYGKCDDQDNPCQQPSVVVTWKSNVGIYGYLLFHPDKTVEVISGDGGVYNIKKKGSKKLFMKEYEGAEFPNLLASFSGCYNNLIQFSDYITWEKEMIKRDNSRVKPHYYYLSSEEE